MTKILKRISNQSLSYSTVLSFNSKGFSSVSVDKNFDRIRLCLRVKLQGYKGEAVGYSQQYNKYQLGVILDNTQIRDIAAWYADFQAMAVPTFKHHGSLHFKPVVSDSGKMWFNWPKSNNEFERILINTLSGVSRISPEELNKHEDIETAIKMETPVTAYVEPYIYAQQKEDGITFGVSWQLREIAVIN